MFVIGLNFDKMYVLVLKFLLFPCVLYRFLEFEILIWRYLFIFSTFCSFLSLLEINCLVCLFLLNNITFFVKIFYFLSIIVNPSRIC